MADRDKFGEYLEKRAARLGLPTDPEAWKDGGLAVAATAYDLGEAELIARQLNARDIPAWVDGANIALLDLPGSSADHPVGLPVVVPRGRLEDARVVLAALGKAETPRDRAYLEYLDDIAERFRMPKLSDVARGGPWVPVATTFNPDEALGLEALLREAEIPVLLVPPVRFYVTDNAMRSRGIRVAVPAKEAPRAQTLVKDVWPQEKAAMEAEAAEEKKPAERPEDLPPDTQEDLSKHSSAPSCLSLFAAFTPMAPVVLTIALLQLNTLPRDPPPPGIDPYLERKGLVVEITVAAIFTLGWIVLVTALVAAST